VPELDPGPGFTVSPGRTGLQLSFSGGTGRGSGAVWKGKGAQQ